MPSSVELLSLLELAAEDSDELSEVSISPAAFIVVAVLDDVVDFDEKVFDEDFDDDLRRPDDGSWLLL